MFRRVESEKANYHYIVFKSFIWHDKQHGSLNITNITPNSEHRNGLGFHLVMGLNLQRELSLNGADWELT